MDWKKVLFWVVYPVVMAALCVFLVCKVKSCVDALPERAVEAGRALVPAKMPASAERWFARVESAAAVTPAATRRPLFGTERTPGTELTILPGDMSPGDTLKLFVGRDGTVENRGRDSVTVSVVRVLKPWVQWDPGAGWCVLAGAGRYERSIIREWQGMHFDLALKGKLVDFPVFETGFEIGAPVVYVASSGVGVGVDLKHDILEFVTLDVGWFYPEQAVRVGVGVCF